MPEIITKLYDADSLEHISSLFGSFDSNIKLMEKELDVRIIARGVTLKVEGVAPNVDCAMHAIDSLFNIIRKGDELTEQNVRYAITMAQEGSSLTVEALSDDYVCITAKGKPIKAKTLGQKQYVKTIRENTVTFGIGPAGTGKTFLAVALAVEAFRKKEVSRIILTRPAVEAGEKLGFLPGDLQNKVDPYLRPLYDAMFEMMGSENYQKYLERNQIEVAPLAYMRGRTLDDAFIILDEAQNTTPEQMKMFLTRIGFGSKVVVTGDVTQIDLPDGKYSGLKDAIRILKDVEGLDFMWLTQKDVVRHPLVQRIIAAYEKNSKPKGGNTK